MHSLALLGTKWVGRGLSLLCRYRSSVVVGADFFKGCVDKFTTREKTKCAARGSRVKKKQTIVCFFLPFLYPQRRYENIFGPGLESNNVETKALKRRLSVASKPILEICV